MPPAIAALIILVVFVLAFYLWLGIRVSQLRVRFGIAAPRMDGPPEFERAVRIHANTLEQLVPFLVGLYLCATWFSAFVALILGIVWLAGRLWYALAYWQDAGRRAPGFILAFMALVALLACAAFSAIRALLLI